MHSVRILSLESKLTKAARKKAEKLISQQKILHAIIESKKMDKGAKLVTNYQRNEEQRNNQFYSTTENLAFLGIGIEEYERTLSKLDLIYNSLKPSQRKIWDERYLNGRTDVDVYMDEGLTDRTYYRLKKEMISVVAEAFSLLD